MTPALRGREERIRELKEEVEIIISQLVYLIDPDRIILYGSLERGILFAANDINFLVIGPTDEPPRRRHWQLNWMIDTNEALYARWYTQEELIHLVQTNPHVRAITKGGHVVYDRPFRLPPGL